MVKEEQSYVKKITACAKVKNNLDSCVKLQFIIAHYGSITVGVSPNARQTL